jgi:hypothetical protein
MPSINVEGFELQIRPRDHPPPHVHVFRAEGEAKITLGSKDERPRIWQVWEMSKKDLVRALGLTIEYQAELLKMWERFHGEAGSMGNP